MSDQFNDAFLRQRRNLVLTSSVLLVYIGAEVKLRTFNGVVVSGEVNNESFLVSFMLVLIGYFLIRFFQCMNSENTKFRHKWHESVKGKGTMLVQFELMDQLSEENKARIAIKKVEAIGRDIFVHIVDKGIMSSAIKKSSDKKFVSCDAYRDDSGGDGDIDVVHIDKAKAIRFWVTSWFSISWRTSLLTEYYLPVVYSVCVVWWYVTLNI